MRVELDEAALEELFHDPDGPVGEIMEHKAENVEAAMHSLLAQPGAGELYFTAFYTDKGGHVHPTNLPGLVEHASVPGAPPSSTTEHFYDDSLFHELDQGPNGIGAIIGSTWYVSLILEHGAKHMAPRPLMRPALDIGLSFE